MKKIGAPKGAPYPPPFGGGASPPAGMKNNSAGPSHALQLHMTCTTSLCNVCQSQRLNLGFDEGDPFHGFLQRVCQWVDPFVLTAEK